MAAGGARAGAAPGEEPRTPPAPRVSLPVFLGRDEVSRGLLGGKFMLAQMIGVLLLVAGVAELTMLLTPVESADDLAYMSTVTAGLTTLIAFYMSSLIKVNVGRWHHIREEHFEGLWAAANQLCFRAALLFPGAKRHVHATFCFTHIFDFLD